VSAAVVTRSGSTGTRAARGGGGLRVALLVAVLAAVVLVYLTSRASPAVPFSIDSTQPDGYGALALLARGEGANVTSIGAAELTGGRSADAVVVPRPSRLGAEERRGLLELARGGAVVVMGERFEGAIEDELTFGDPYAVPFRELADDPAIESPPGQCDIASLVGLGDIDTAFSLPIPVLQGERSCYGTGTEAYFTERAEGAGTVVTMSDPLLWVNARLQPAKEEGGQPLDNAATFLALTGAGPGTALRFVDPASGSGDAPNGTCDPIELLPLPVKLALVQGLVALVFWLWWRGRRLGRPVTEPLPVEIAASELVGAVGDLLRRRGSAGRAATSMRQDTHRLLARRLGFPQGAPSGALVERVAALTGRPPAEVAAVLLDPGEPGGTAVPDTEALLRLTHQLDAIRQEVLDEQPVR